MKIIFTLLLFFSISTIIAQTQCNKRANKVKGVQLASSGHINLMNQYDWKHAHIDLNVERTTTTLSGNTTLKAQALVNNLSTFAFELHSNLTIDSVYVNASKSTFTRNVHEAIANIPSPINSGSIVTVKVFYRGTPPTQGTGPFGAGVTNATSGRWGNQVTWSLSEPYAAFEWWPTKQVLHDKLDSSSMSLTTSIENMAGSNGLLISIDTLPNNKRRFNWHSSYPINYYLVSYSVAKYVDYSTYAHPTGSDSILIQNYVYDNPQTLPTFKGILDSTALMIETLSDLYGLYPFHSEKYGHCMAPISGGMEHQTMTTLGFFDFTLVAHELGHQWFGDNVTCESWQDIWVNEGFASYTEYILLEKLRPLNERVTWLNDAHSNVMSAATGSVYCDDTTSDTRIFSSRLSYDKGASIIHTLRFVINDDQKFFQGLQQYQNQYRDKVAKGVDFKAVMENVTGQNLQQFFDQWYFGQGYPIWNVKYSHQNNILYLKLTETTSASTFFITPLELKIKRTQGDTIIKVFQSQAVEYFYINITGNITGITVDPNNWIINQVNGITVDNSLATKTEESTKQIPVNIYPNPTSGIITLDFPKEDKYFVTITDAVGKIVYNQNHKTNKLELNLSSWSAGIYNVNISAKNYNSVNKIIKE